MSQSRVFFESERSTGEPTPEEKRGVETMTSDQIIGELQLLTQQIEEEDKHSNNGKHSERFDVLVDRYRLLRDAYMNTQGTDPQTDPRVGTLKLKG